MADQESSPSTSNATASSTKKASKQPKQTIESVLNDVKPFLGGNLDLKTVHQKISASDLTKAAATLMLQHYKVQDENILRTIALSMSDVESLNAENDFKNNFGNIQPSLESLARYKQMFMEKNTGKLLSKEATTDLFGHAEDLDMAANVALQAELLVSAISLTGIRPPGMKLTLASSKTSGLKRPEIKKRLSLIVTLSEVLFYKSKSFSDLPASNIQKLHKDLLKIASTF